MPQAVYIVNSIRSPVGKAGGVFKQVRPDDLLSFVLKELLKNNPNIDPKAIDDVIIGCAMPEAEQGFNIARIAALLANYPQSVSGVTVNRFCASGLETVNMAAMKVRSGWENLIVAGGVECMSRVPMGSDGGSMAFEPKVNLRTQFVPQGIGADLIATLGGHSREDVDAFAVESQRRAAHASSQGYFESIVPVTDQNGLDVLANDEHIRPNTTMDDLSGLKPAFEIIGNLGYDAVALGKYTGVEAINHVHTAGNSSGINDIPMLVLHIK